MVDEKGEPWFVGKDVAENLGYSNTRDSLKKHVDEEDKTTVAICDTGSRKPSLLHHLLDKKPSVIWKILLYLYPKAKCL